MLVINESKVLVSARNEGNSPGWNCTDCGAIYCAGARSIRSSYKLEMKLNCKWKMLFNSVIWVYISFLNCLCYSVVSSKILKLLLFSITSLFLLELHVTFCVMAICSCQWRPIAMHQLVWDYGQVCSCAGEFLASTSRRRDPTRHPLPSCRPQHHGVCSLEDTLLFRRASFLALLVWILRV